MFFKRSDGGDDVGCGFLSERQIGAFLERGADPEAQDRFERHLREGCGECLHLAAAMEEFRGLLERGAVSSERSRFAETRHLFGTRLRHEVQAGLDGEQQEFPGLGGARGLTSRELEQIAAAGKDPVVDPGLGDGNGSDDDNDPRGRD